MTENTAVKSVESLWRSIAERRQRLGLPKMTDLKLGEPLTIMAMIVIGTVVTVIFLSVFNSILGMWHESSTWDRFERWMRTLPPEKAEYLIGLVKGLRENTNLFDVLTNAAYLVLGAACILGVALVGSAVAPGIVSGIGNRIGSWIEDAGMGKAKGSGPLEERGEEGKGNAPAPRPSVGPSTGIKPLSTFPSRASVYG